jgi:hypothetical protein
MGLYAVMLQTMKVSASPLARAQLNPISLLLRPRSEPPVTDRPPWPDMVVNQYFPSRQLVWNVPNVIHASDFWSKSIFSASFAVRMVISFGTQHGEGNEPRPQSHEGSLIGKVNYAA